MSANPEFFVEVLSAVYRPSEGSGVTEATAKDSEHAKAISYRAFDLLRSWRQVPGEASGVIDASVLMDWVNRARILCAKAGRAEVGDQQIGSMLASAPGDANGTWPHKAVRDVIEIIRSRELENGVMLGVHNNRGVTSRLLTDGGIQERAIARRYHESAEAIGLEWPRTSALLERIAKSYEEQGHWHDQNAARTDWSI
jgi:hypothetical protein